MIYGRFGDSVTIARVGTLDDVQRLDGRKPDKTDRDAVANGSYVVVRCEDGDELLYHQAFLRADGGSREITAAIEALPKTATGERPTANLTQRQRETLGRVRRSTTEWYRASGNGERVTLASLHRRGLLRRRAWRKGKSSADDAHEYCVIPELAALDKDPQP